MKPGQTINIQLTSRDNEPLPMGNVLVLINLFIGGRYRYGFFVGRTDDRGRLNVSYEDVEKLRHASAVQSVMDYNTKLDDCDPLIQIVVPTEEDLLGRKQRAFEHYGRIPSWAVTWPSNANVKAHEITVNLVAPTVEALVPAD